MTATIIKFPQRPRPDWLTSDPRIRKAMSLLPSVSLELTKRAIKPIEQWERTHPPA